MKYLKQHLTYEEQARHLIARGLLADENILQQRLAEVGFYRLSAYTFPFRNEGGDKGFRAGTSLEKVWKLYLFDRKLRLALLDAIERIEVALRCKIAYYHTKGQSPFAYAQASYFPEWNKYEQSLVRFKAPDESEKLASEQFVGHFFEKYGDSHQHLPLWMAVSVMELGTLVFFYVHSDEGIRNQIASEWGVDEKSLKSWLHALRRLRNICAHHARVWNRRFVFKPRIPSHSLDERWHYVFSEKANKWVRPSRPYRVKSYFEGVQPSLAPLVYICRSLMRSLAPSSCWHERMQKILLQAGTNGVDLTEMGFPKYWEKHPLWV